MRTYAIGDIHGHLDQLRRVHDWILHDQATHGPAPVVHIGDLVDRGPDSQGVVEFLRAGIASGQDWIVLKGNHDRMFTNYLRDLTYHDPRLRAEMSYLQGLRYGAIVGSAAQVRDKLETLAGQLNVDEVVIVTWAWNPQDQVRSYELLAREFGLS